ncbi:hypothetical protein [Segetibacter koreensis]|uniref:hypothetical protein n=1 Tax=Segetibacter koreensis TaxID=398037 RepID=UPI00035DD032|nr:hypothetical protein [Segetibacter koreensis]
MVDQVIDMLFTGIGIVLKRTLQSKTPLSGKLVAWTVILNKTAAKKGRLSHHEL